MQNFIKIIFFWQIDFGRKSIFFIFHQKKYLVFFPSKIFFILYRSAIPGILKLIPCLSKSTSPGDRNWVIFLVNLSYTYFVTYPWHRLDIHISVMRPPQKKLSLSCSSLGSIYPGWDRSEFC